MSGQEQEIILGSLDLFLKYGIRSVTMDDVSSEMGISKKTVYKFFENKADLVHKCVMQVYSTIQASMEAIHSASSNAIDELFEIDKVVKGIMEMHNPGIQFQLKKYYPKTFKELYDKRRQLIVRMISENIENGKDQGLYRLEADTEVITYLYCSKVETIPEDEENFIKPEDFRRVVSEALIYHIRGVASAEGLKYLETKLKNEKL